MFTDKPDLAEPSNPEGSFDLNEHHFACFTPASSAEKTAFLILVTKGDKEVHKELIPMVYEPRFGIDVGDLALRDARIEEIIKELKLE